jgi:NADPH-dependent 2,4-dienoyl-CoA reductase/sulfur reductase-like enzyme
VRIEHWRLAQQHGRHAARVMLGHEAPFEDVPFFWTGQFGLSLRYVGHAEDFEEVIVDGAHRSHIWQPMSQTLCREQGQNCRLSNPK